MSYEDKIPLTNEKIKGRNDQKEFKLRGRENRRCRPEHELLTFLKLLTDSN